MNMVSLSQSIAGIPPSPTQAAADRANALKAQGKDVVSLTVGEPDFDTPKHVKDAAIDAMNKGFTRYVAAQGIMPLREVICAKLRRDQNIEYSPKDVIVTNGGKHALAAACAVLLNPGEEAIIPAPYWTSYPDMVRLAGGEPVIVETTPESGYLMTPEQLLKAITPKTKILFLNTPSNPTGACYTGAQLRALADAIKSLEHKKDLVIISDEVYEYITFNGFKHESFLTVAPELRDQTMIVNAFSKAYAMTGWRVGFAAGPRDIIEAMAVHQSQFTSNVCTIAQYAASKAFEDNYAFPNMMRAEFEKRLEIVWNAVAEMPGIRLSVKPRGAFYAFLEIDELVGKKNGKTEIRGGQDFANYLLEQFDVVVVQGEAFGAKAAVRMSFALGTAALEKGLRRIHEAAASLA